MSDDRRLWKIVLVGDGAVVAVYVPDPPVGKVKDCIMVDLNILAVIYSY